MKLLIVDDEEDARIALKNILKDLEVDISIIGEAGTVKEASSMIMEFKPDLILLDIQLNQSSSFELFSYIDEMPKVIFITAFDKYAVDAFKVNAIDYLLKPVSPNDLKSAIEKVNETNGDDSLIKEKIIKNFEVNVKKILISTSSSHLLVDIDKIVHCQADVNYTHLFLEEDKKITSPKTLKYFENKLPSNEFFRIHQSHLININYVHSLNKEYGGFVELKNGKQLPISRRRLGRFIDYFNQ